MRGVGDGRAGVPRAAGVVALVACLAGAGAARADAPERILVVKRAGIAAYQEVTDEFRENCRVRARVLDLGGGPLPLRPSDVVLAVGQQALDEVRKSGARVVSALALHVPIGTMRADEQPPPELSLKALKVARPSVRRVGVVYGPRSDRLVARMEDAAGPLGLVIVKARAKDGPGAVRQLRRIADAGIVDALWLAPDLDVLVPQLFQYALTLEIRTGLPVVAVTRQQVKAGALLAVDADPRAVGQQAAQLVNELLAGTPAEEVMAGSTGRLELVVNAAVARRLGADVAALKRMGVRVE